MTKKILFLSALDFKDKSIQVIRKTPETYVKAGWEVHYVVARDDSKHGNYFYEKAFDCDGVKTYRFKWPLQSLRDRVISRIPLLLLTKLISWLVVVKLAWVGVKVLRNVDIAVVYGYELHGVLAMNLLRLCSLNKNLKKVSRFQGTFLNDMLEAKQYDRIFFNLDLCLALRLPSDLCIMTNDGTQGNKAVEKIAPNNLKVLKFWVNGVDYHNYENQQVLAIQDSLQLEGKVVFLSISRLVNWKRVDRAIKVFSILKDKYGSKQFKYLIVGEGQERASLEELVKALGLSDYVQFIGSIPNSSVRNYLQVADYFVSTYDASNVGNPLLEAMRANKIIFTLNNGDTGSWIQHRINGFIYDLEEDFFTAMAKDMHEVIHDDKLRANLIDGVKKTAATQLWTWEERFNSEIDAVEGLFTE